MGISDELEVLDAVFRNSGVAGVLILKGRKYNANVVK
jgi:hypothetical protein